MIMKDHFDGKRYKLISNVCQGKTMYAKGR